jgi:guanylate kinase
MRVITPQELLRRALGSRSPAGAMRVTEFLTALPAIGEGKRDRVLAELEIAPVKRLGGLGTRQRAARAWLDGASRFRPRAAAAARVGRPDGRRQGHRRRAHQGSPPRDPALGVRDDARSASGRGRRRALLLRRRRSTPDRERELLEHATVHNAYRYGTPKAPSRRLAEGRTVLLEIDLQGARQVRAAAPSRPRLPAPAELGRARPAARRPRHRRRGGARAPSAHGEGRACLAGRVRLPRRQRRRRPAAAEVALAR